MATTYLSPLSPITTEPTPITGDLNQGIPTQEDNPLMAELQRPALEREADEAAQTEEFIRDRAKTLQKNLLDPSTIEHDFSRTSNPEAAKKQALAMAYVRLQNGGEPIPGGKVGYQITRDRIAAKKFNGAGKGDDLAFFDQIQAEAVHNKEKLELAQKVQAEAVTNTFKSLFASTVAGPAKPWKEQLEEIKKSPGYTPGNEFQYLELANSVRDEIIADTAGDRGFYIQLFNAITAPAKEDNAAFRNAETLYLEKIKSIQDPAERAEMRDKFRNFITNMVSILPDQNRGEAYDPNMPGISKDSFIGQMNIQSRRSITDIGRNIAAGKQVFVTVQTDEGEVILGPSDVDPNRTNKRTFKVDGKTVPEEELYRNAMVQSEKEFEAQYFAEDMQAIRRNIYAPIEKKWGSGFMGDVEAGIYAMPGAVATTVVAAVPYIGQALTFKMLQGAAASDMRQQLMSQGVSDVDATRIADENSAIIGAIQYIPERIGAKAVTRQLPWLERAHTAISNRITNKLMRGVIAGAVVGSVELGTELFQNQVPNVAQDLIAELDEEIPGFDWQKEADGFWSETITTAVAILPLAMMGAAGGMNNEARTRAFADLPSRVRLAYGITPEADLAIENAKKEGPESLNQAVENAQATRDPRSESAKDAVQEIAEEMQAAAQAAAELEKSELFPLINYDTESKTYTLFDKNTNEEIGQARTPEAAVRLAAAWNQSVELEESDYLTYLVTTLQGATESAQLDADPTYPEINQRKTSYTFDLARTLSANEAAQQSAENASRVESQLRVKENAATGSSDMTQVVFGQSTTDPTSLKRKFRETTNKLYRGASILKVFHEETHGFWREALSTGRLTKTEAVDLLKALDQVGSTVSTKSGQSTRYLREDFDSMTEEDQNTAIDEAIAELMEAEILRTRKGGGVRVTSKNLVSRNLSAIARLTGDKTAGKFKAFIDAVRAFFGITMDRALILKRGIKEGTIDQAGYESFLNRLYGLTEDAEFERFKQEAEQSILDEVEFDEEAAILEDFPDGNPFSIGRSTITPEPGTQVFQGDENSPSVVGPASFSIGAWHGTPHKVDKFSTEKIGTGEGAQAYGWGLYFAASKAVADNYRKDLSGFEQLYLTTSEGKKTGDKLDWIDLEIAKYLEQGSRDAGQFQHNTLYYAKQRITSTNNKEILKRFEEYGRDLKSGYEKNNGTLYRVELNADEDQLLDWDKPLADQSDFVKSAIQKFIDDIKASDLSDVYKNTLQGAELIGMPGETFYRIATQDQNAKNVSRDLALAGIKGIRYLDGNSRNQGEGSYNYVIFNEADITILEENGQPVSFSIGKPWPADFPKIPVHTTTGNLKSHPDYTAAKAGDSVAAYNVIRDRIKKDRITELAAKHPGAIVVALHGVEASGMNKLPMALAAAISHHGNLPLDTEIVMVNKPKRTGSTAVHRLASRPEFTGPVQSGATYILADDVATQGGTISEARAYIEEKGGQVVAAMTLSAAQGGTILALTPKTKLALIEKFTEKALNEFATETGLYQGQWEAFTESEGRAILSFNKLETAKDRIFAARQEAGSTRVAGTFQQGELSFSLGQSRLAELDQKYLAAVEAGDMDTAQQMVDDAAKAAGYTIRAKHGTAEKFDRFDLKQGGKMTDAKSARKAIFLTDDEKTANSYAIYAAETGPVKEALRQAEAAEKKGDWDGYDEAIRQAEELDTYEASYKRREKAVIIDAYIAGDFLEFDAEGKTPQELNDEDIDKGITEQIKNAQRQGKTGVIYRNLDDAINLNNRPATHYAVFKPSQIKSAETITRDAEGNIIPLSQRFNPQDDRLAYSLGQSRLADLLAEDAYRRIRNPEARAKALSKITRDLAYLRTEAEKLELTMGSKRLTKSLRREAAMRQAMRQEELENQALARHQGILSAEEQATLSNYPIHGALIREETQVYKDKDGRTRRRTVKKGRLMSRTRAASRHPDMFSRDNAGEYDGAEGMSPVIYGGENMPDTIAQELYDAGLINSPTPDALWEALRREQNSVAKMKDALIKAKEELRAARSTAITETRDWLATQVNIQDNEYSAKQEILRASALLDAILAALPAQLRGQIGGYTPLARLGTNESRLSFLRDRLDKADRLLEKYLRKQFDREFRLLLDRARPEKDEAGKRPKGKLGSTVHELFDDIRDAMLLNSTEVSALVASLDVLAMDPDNSPEQQAHAMLASNLVSLAGNWNNADAGRMEMALKEAQSIYNKGYGEAMVEAKRKAERRQDARQHFQTATGSDGHRMDRVKKRDKENTRRNLPKKFLQSLYSFEQIVELAFGKNMPEAKTLVEWERRAANAKHDAVTHKTQLVEQLFAFLAGGKYKGEELRWKMSQSGTIKAKDGRGIEHTFSVLEAIHATMLWRQEDGRRHMEGHKDENGNPTGNWHWTDAAMDQIENQLDGNAKAVRMHLTEQYAAEYDRLNSIYKSLYGVSLPKHKFYSPITVMPVQTQLGQINDPVTGMAIGTNMMSPGALKTRSTSAIAEPDLEKDALQVYLAHTMQMEHWMAYAPFATEAQAIFGNRELRNSVKASAGNETLIQLSGWLEHFGQGGNRDAAAHLALTQTLNRALGRAATVALVGRVSVLAIQSTQLLAAAHAMPMGAFVTRFAKLLTGQLEWKAALKSDYIKRRLEQMPPIVRQSMEALAYAKPSKIKYLSQKMGQTISGADAFFTGGTYAIAFDYHYTQAIKEGHSPADAETIAHKEAEAATDRVAQPTKTATRSYLEVTSTNPFMRLAWSFASEARQKLALSAFAFSSETTVGEKARALFVTWIAGGVIASLIRAAMSDLRNDDDDEWFDERNWDPKRLALQSITGPFAGLPVIGDSLEAAVFKLLGVFAPEGNLFSMGSKGIESATKIPDWFTGERDFIQAAGDVEKIISGAGLFSGNAAAAASLSHVVVDAFKFIDNLTDND